MNQLKVTGMLSSPCAPFGQPTASSVPQEALRIFGSGRARKPGRAGARREQAEGERRDQRHAEAFRRPHALTASRSAFRATT